MDPMDAQGTFRKAAWIVAGAALAILLAASWEAREPIAVKTGLRDFLIRRALERTSLTFDFEERSLADVLRHLEGQLEVPFAVKAEIPTEELTVILHGRKKAGDALSEIMTMTGLDHEVSGGKILIREKRPGPGSWTIDVRELLGNRTSAPEPDR
jgi:hypothetical protein